MGVGFVGWGVYGTPLDLSGAPPPSDPILREVAVGGCQVREPGVTDLVFLPILVDFRAQAEWKASRQQMHMPQSSEM